MQTPGARVPYTGLVEQAGGCSARKNDKERTCGTAVKQRSAPSALGIPKKIAPRCEWSRCSLVGWLRHSNGRSPPSCMPDHALVGSMLDEIGDDVSCRRRTETAAGVLRAPPRRWPISAIHCTGSPAAPQLPGDLPLGQ